tara:strand:- start:333 stop:773 length:441 start_codon:yes stop_codon:yes gene_type:complete
MESIWAILLIICSIAHISLYVSKDMWDNVELYTPSWGNEVTVTLFIYLFVIFVFINFSLSKRIKEVDAFLYVFTIIIFAFVIFSLSVSTTEEAFTWATIVLFLVICNVILAFVSKDNNSKILSITPLIFYLYLYAWLVQTNDNNVD